MNKHERYAKATERLGFLVYKTFRDYPWKYDREAKAWALYGENNVINFYEREKLGGEGVDHRCQIIVKLGKIFEGYTIIVDTQDSYIWIGLD